MHAPTSNAHGPAAFTRMRSRLASRREMNLRPGVSRPTHALRFHCEPRRGRVTRRPLLLDALEHRLARVQRCRNALVVVGSAATQPLPTRYDLWGHRDRRSHVRQRIRRILRLKRANGVKRSQEVYFEARTSRFSTEIRTLQVERIVDELGFVYATYTKCDTTPLISTLQVSLNIHRLDLNFVFWKKGKLSSRLKPERDRFKPLMNTLGNKKDTRKKNYRIDLNFSSTLPERFFPFIIFK